MSNRKDPRVRSVSLEKRYSGAFLADLGSLCRPDGYLSHLGALHLHGLVPEPPAVLTIVSPRRRRHRLLQGIEVRVVYHSPRGKPDLCDLGDAMHPLPVATVETAVVDLLADLDQAPEPAGLREIVSRLPFSTGRVLCLAETVSDTVFKRAAYLLGWSGRLSFSRVPFERFHPSPARLDPRSEEADERCWDPRFHLFLPRLLLREPVPVSPSPGPMGLDLTADWLCLRNSPAFREAQHVYGRLILRGDPELPDLGRLLLPDLKEWDGDRLTAWGRGLGLIRLPELASRKRRERIRRVLSRLFGASAIPRILTQSSALSRLPDEAADLLLHFALIFGDHETAWRTAERWGERLIDRPALTGLRSAARHLLSGAEPSSAAAEASTASSGGHDPRADCFLVMSLLACGDIETAAGIFSRMPVPEKESGAFPWYRLVEGMILFRCNRPREAVVPLREARSVWRKTNLYFPLTRTEVCLGIAFLDLREFGRADRHFKAARAYLRKAGKGNPALSAMVHANAGINEYHLGKRGTADRRLKRAIALARTAGHAGVESRALQYRGLIHLHQGFFGRAVRLFQACHRIRRENGDRPGAAKAASLLVLACGCMGWRGAVARWLAQIPGSTGAEQVFRLLAEGRDFLLHGKPEPAFLRLSRAWSRAECLQMGPLMRARLSVLQDLARFLAFPGAHIGADDAIEIVLRGEPSLDEALVLRLAYLVMRSGAGERVAISRVVGIMENLRQGGVCDPFWFLLAPHLLRLAKRPAEEYLVFQDRLSSLAIRAAGRHFLVRQGARDVLACLRTSSDGWRILRIDSNGATLLDEEGYRLGKTQGAENGLDIDFSTGLATLSPREVRFRPGTTPFRLLGLLLQALPEPVSAEQAYRLIWDRDYDEEFDLPTVKTTIVRLRSWLRPICPAARIRVAQSLARGCRVHLQLPPGWRAWIPEPVTDRET